MAQSYFTQQTKDLCNFVLVCTLSISLACLFASTHNPVAIKGRLPELSANLLAQSIPANIEFGDEGTLFETDEHYISVKKGSLMISGTDWENFQSISTELGEGESFYQGLEHDREICGVSLPTPEVCDGTDNYCDQQIDEGFDGTIVEKALSCGIQQFSKLTTDKDDLPPACGVVVMTIACPNGLTHQCVDSECDLWSCPEELVNE